MSTTDSPENKLALTTFAQTTLSTLLPLLKHCPGHWFRQYSSPNPLGASHTDITYIRACFHAILKFNQTALLQGIRDDQFSDSYHELRERDPDFLEVWKAAWTNPFAAALALKEFVDTSTYFMKMMRDCVEIGCKRPWEGDPWAEMGHDNREKFKEWFKEYNSKLPGNGTGDWKPPMRSELADEQARAWGLKTVEDVEAKLGMKSRESGKDGKKEKRVWSQMTVADMEERLGVKEEDRLGARKSEDVQRAVEQVEELPTKSTPELVRSSSLSLRTPSLAKAMKRFSGSMKSPESGSSPRS